ncbi:hypothetical protein FKR81_32370 [Lentzea tibetensis]|uniref:Uncharacterized protein n=1 Tax=Lentzea tibetensis TaxID=2591470 RepID=A0A563EKK6_9PSEU|nr:hypothetical protein [Lentzea tibetensis]TWP47411.1 hypothetical protein FKR81_32370 [Lentzea tibetensis]
MIENPRPDQSVSDHARLMLEVAIDQLVQPGHVHVERQAPDGTARNELAEVLPLLDQVAEAVHPGSERTGKSVHGSRPPASLAPLALVSEIRGVVRQACRGHDHDQPGELRERLALWARHAEQWQLTAFDYLAWAADRATEWVREARLLLDPPPRFPLHGKACPMCRATAVQVWSDDENDYLRRPALSIDPERVEAVCAACDARWGMDVWGQLAAAIDQQHRETLTVTEITASAGEKS